MLKCIQIIFIFIYFYNTSALQCVDHDKNPVDWYVINKLPKEDHDNDLIAQGAAYTYITSNDVNGWKLSDISINDSNSIVGLTLEKLYDSDSDVMYILYNDALPDGSTSSKKGHTKGLVLGDSDGGLWLVHSVPHFPSVDDGEYFYPHSGYRNGQSFLCVSLNIENLDKVGTQLQYNLPNIYSSNMPSNLQSELPNLADVIDDVTVNEAPWHHIHTLSSVAGMRFISFAKSPKFGKELYADWVAPTLNSSLMVETWPNERGRIYSECNRQFTVNNVNDVYVRIADLEYKDTKDHSKWAVSSTTSSEDQKWICIGDINRAKPQKHRGGGTLCFSMGKVAESYQEIISDADSC